MWEPTDAQVELPEPAFASASGLEILSFLSLKKKKTEDLLTLREVTNRCWRMRP